MINYSQVKLLFQNQAHQPTKISSLDHLKSGEGYLNPVAVINSLLIGDTDHAYFNNWTGSSREVRLEWSYMVGRIL